MYRYAATNLIILHYLATQRKQESKRASEQAKKKVFFILFLFREAKSIPDGNVHYSLLKTLAAMWVYATAEGAREGTGTRETRHVADIVQLPTFVATPSRLPGAAWVRILNAGFHGASWGRELQSARREGPLAPRVGPGALPQDSPTTRLSSLFVFPLR